MSENLTEPKPLPTIWSTPDELWEVIEPILKEHDAPKKCGQPRIDQREALDAIIFRMRSGCQWNLEIATIDGGSSPCSPRRVVGTDLLITLGDGFLGERG